MTVAVLVATAPLPVYGLSCMPFILSESADEVDVAFTGRQIHRFESDSRSLLVFEVKRVYKGQAGHLFAVRTNPIEAWGLDFQGVGIVGVVAHQLGAHLWAGYCTSPVGLNELLSVFGEGTPPDDALGLEPWIEALVLEASDAEAFDVGTEASLPIQILVTAAVLGTIVGAVAVLHYRQKRLQRLEEE